MVVSETGHPTPTVQKFLFKVRAAGCRLPDSRSTACVRRATGMPRLFSHADQARPIHTLVVEDEVETLEFVSDPLET
jgi:hypothetical protein